MQRENRNCFLVIKLVQSVHVLCGSLLFHQNVTWSVPFITWKVVLSAVIIVSSSNICMCTSRNTVDILWIFTDGTFPLNHYKDVRSIHSLNRHATLHTATKKIGVKNPPLLNIELDHVLLDELHLLLRITDVLLRNIIMMMVKFDRNGPSTNHLQSLVKAVRECGISFSVWETKEENATSGKVGGYDWTSLMGRDKRRLLQVNYSLIGWHLWYWMKYFSNHSSFL